MTESSTSYNTGTGGDGGYTYEQVPEGYGTQVGYPLSPTEYVPQGETTGGYGTDGGYTDGGYTGAVPGGYATGFAPAEGTTGYPLGESAPTGYDTGYGTGGTGYDTGYGTGGTGYDTGYGTGGTTGYDSGYGTDGTGYDSGYGTGGTGYDTGYGTGGTGYDSGYGTGGTGYDTGYGTGGTGYGTGGTGYDSGYGTGGTGTTGTEAGTTGTGTSSTSGSSSTSDSSSSDSSDSSDSDSSDSDSSDSDSSDSDSDSDSNFDSSGEYRDWTWKQVMAHVTGYDPDDASVNGSESSNPQTLQNAADGFWYVAQVLKEVGDNLAAQMESLTGENGSWQGPAAQSFGGLMQNLTQQVSNLTDTLSGGVTGNYNVAQQLADNAQHLRDAINTLYDMDNWYAQEAIKWYAENRKPSDPPDIIMDDTGQVAISQAKPVVDMMTNDMRKVLIDLASHYKLTTNSVPDVSFNSPSIGSGGSLGGSYPSAGSGMGSTGGYPNPTGSSGTSGTLSPLYPGIGPMVSPTEGGYSGSTGSSGTSGTLRPPYLGIGPVVHPTEGGGQDPNPVVVPAGQMPATQDQDVPAMAQELRVVRRNEGEPASSTDGSEEPRELHRTAETHVRLAQHVRNQSDAAPASSTDGSQDPGVRYLSRTEAVPATSTDGTDAPQVRYADRTEAVPATSTDGTEAPQVRYADRTEAVPATSTDGTDAPHVRYADRTEAVPATSSDGSQPEQTFHKLEPEHALLRAEPQDQPKYDVPDQNTLTRQESPTSGDLAALARDQEAIKDDKAAQAAHAIAFVQDAASGSGDGLPGF